VTQEVNSTTRDNSDDHAQLAQTVAFDRQRRNAKSRGIPFLLTFEEWWAWWQVDGRWAQRGRRKGCLVMARYGDVGPYAIWNIYCSTAGDNVALGRKATPKRPEAIQKAIATRRLTDDFAHLRDRPNHPKRHPVVSPAGAFPSIALAAKANGLTAHYAQKLASRGIKGWSYAEVTP
jgi:hypothetical protein